MPYRESTISNVTARLISLKRHERQTKSRAYVIEDAEGEQPEQKGFWTRIGSAWPHKDGKGLNIQIVSGVAVSGRIVLREYTPEDEAIEAKKAKRTK